MLIFLGAIVGTFILCIIWVGGYLADLLIWIISKFVPDSANEGSVSRILGAILGVIGIIMALTAGFYSESSRTIGGGVLAGVGVYIAVFAPGRIRANRERKAEKAAKKAAKYGGISPTSNDPGAISQPTYGSYDSPVDPSYSAGQPSYNAGIDSSSPQQSAGQPSYNAGIDSSSPQQSVTPQTTSLISATTSAAELASIAQGHPECWLEIAQHPNAYPELLSWLQSSGDAQVQQAVAARLSA